MTVPRFVLVTIVILCIAVNIHAKRPGAQPEQASTHGILNSLRNSPDSSFLVPNTTLYKLDSNQVRAFHNVDQWVLLQVELNKDNSVKRATAEYCSSPNAGLERLAIDTVRNQHFETAASHGDNDLFWHRVVFTGNDTVSKWDPSGIPQADEYVPLEVNPEMTYQPPLQYPRSSMSGRNSASVQVKALVDKDGAVRKVEISKSSGSSVLDDAAVANAYQCEFKPAMQGGRPVAVWVTFQLNFKK